MNTPFEGSAAPSPEASTAHPRTLAVVSAGTSDPSTTTMLANRVAEAAAKLAAQRGIELRVRFVDLRALAEDVTTALVTQHVSPALQAASDIMRDADAIVASTPVYKAGASGLFTAFFQVLDNDLLIGTPVVLGATAGSARHALVVDDQLRGLFAYLRTITVPTGLFAAPANAAMMLLRDKESKPNVRSQVFTIGAGLRVTAAAIGAAVAGLIAGFDAGWLVAGMAIIWILSGAILWFFPNPPARTGIIPVQKGPQAP